MAKKKKKYIAPRPFFVNGFPMYCGRCTKNLKFIDDRAVEKYNASYLSKDNYFVMECSYCCYHVRMKIERHEEYII